MPSGVIDAALAVKRVHENKYTTNVGSDFRMGECKSVTKSCYKYLT